MLGDAIASKNEARSRGAQKAKLWKSDLGAETPLVTTMPQKKCKCTFVYIPVSTWVEHVLGYTTSNYAGSKWQEHFIRLARSSPNAALMKRTFQSKGNKQS